MIEGRGKETAFLFFLNVGFSRWQKNKCAVCALAFLAQMLKFSTISALLTTDWYKNSRAVKRRKPFG